MKEWIGELTHADLTTPEAQQSLEKYDSRDEALVGGLNAIRQVGKPFKLPKTMADVDHWPDEKDREAFHSGIKELRGGVKTVDDLKDVNFADGLADARHVNEDLVKVVKDFSVERGLSKKDVQDLAKLVNKIAQTGLNTQKASFEQEQKTNTEKVVTGLEAIYGGSDGVDKCKENVRKMLQNDCGLSAHEYEQAKEGLVDLATTKNLILSKALFNLSENFKEGSTTKPTTPGGTPEGDEAPIEKILPDLAKAANWVE